MGRNTTVRSTPLRSFTTKAISRAWGPLKFLAKSIPFRRVFPSRETTVSPTRIFPVLLSAGEPLITSFTKSPGPGWDGSNRKPRCGVTARHATPAGSSTGAGPRRGGPPPVLENAKWEPFSSPSIMLIACPTASISGADMANGKYLARMSFQFRLFSFSSYQLSRMIRQHWSNTSACFPELLTVCSAAKR